jgi:hypothetical protein
MRPNRALTLGLLGAIALVVALTAASLQAAPPPEPPAQPGKFAVRGPFVQGGIGPVVFNGDLRDLPQIAEEVAPREFPLRLTPGELRAGEVRGVLQAEAPFSGFGQMPAPITQFLGLTFNPWGAGWPPDTNGDVGPNHYIQTVNTSIGIWSKTGAFAPVKVTFNNFFPSGTGVCDNQNGGDPVVNYDPMANRWIISDFTTSAPYYQCIAVSQSGDPVSGGWYYYAFQTYPTAAYFPDYPKLGVWPDGIYMTDNMFGTSDFFVRIWAFNRDAFYAGQPLQSIFFDACLAGECGSLLPSNVRGTPPPAGSPNYLASAEYPNWFNIWEFHVDWATPANSTLTGPVQIEMQPFEPAGTVPQQGTTAQLDSLSFRLMHFLQYRNYGTHEALFANHSVDVGGMVVPKWYEVRDPGGSPFIYQEGVHMPDNTRHRWMGSIAADRDGNIALGYSISSSTMYPGIRYAGQRNGEMLGTLPQNEANLYQGTGSQTAAGFGRWGDYSAMTVDPVDDCTFWYTQEYYATTGSNWQTRIGSFKFPACGQALGTVTGRVVNSETGAPISGAPVLVAGTVESLTVQTDATGSYVARVLPGTYTLTGGPLLPGYPTPASVSGIVVAANQTTTAPDIELDPVPYLAYGYATVYDCVAGGNCNGYPDPGESNLGLVVGLHNIGATTASGINATLTALTPGVTVHQGTSGYPNIGAGQMAGNSTQFTFSVDSSVTCGTVLMFRLDVTTAQGSFSIDFSLRTNIPQNPVAVFTDDVENGTNGWTTSGTGTPWQITTEDSHSPTHSWTDSPGGSYGNNQNKSLISPVITLTNQSGVQITAWYKYALESGYDYVYLEYSTNGGTTWNTADPLLTLNGVQATWTSITVDAPQLANVAQARLRYRFFSDAGVVADGIHLDDFTISHTPVVCGQPLPLKLFLPIINKN